MGTAADGPADLARLFALHLVTTPESNDLFNDGLDTGSAQGAWRDFGADAREQGGRQRDDPLLNYAEHEHMSAHDTDDARGW
ncbi:hypothetical protein [Streptomyces murinus]|uniref:hypothetical protein n=1 Tax=Streptomyces murinus TaxID=33900 RepID=UPI00211499CC|nr:hypothetical protein [Streptomyces murinus]